LYIKFMLRVVALLVLSLWAQNVAALSCGPATGNVGGNTAAEFFANASEGTCGSATFAAGPTKNGHIFYANEFGVSAQIIKNGNIFSTSKSLSCTGAVSVANSPSTITASFSSAVAYSTVCTLSYIDGNGQLVTHTFGAGSQDGGGALVGYLNASSVTSGWFERIRPTVVLSGLASTIGSTEQTVTATFSEPVFGFGPLDLNLQNAIGTSYTAVSDSVYVFGITHAAGGGDVLIEVPAGGGADLAGNLNLASNTLTATVDLTGPTVVLSGLAATAGPAPQTITATFSEDVTGFTLADIDAPFMTLANFTAVSASVYTFDLSNGRSVAVSVQIPAGAAADLASNASTASNILTATADPTPPSVWITGLPASIAGPVTFDATINFSEVVTGFVLGDIDISGGTVTGFSGSGTTYIATVSASGLVDLTMSVRANVAQDAALNGNQASGVFTSENVVVEVARAAITRFMQTRANALLSNQPDLAGFLRGGAGQFAAEVTREGGMVNFDSGYDAPLWARLNANWSTDLGAESQYIFGVVGGHSRLSENFLIGGMVQFDISSEVNGLATTKGSGWLIGPYFAAKLAAQPLYFEGSLLYGQTGNTISPLGTYTDAFSTERWLATLGVSGQIMRGNFTWIPFLDAKYTSDAQAAYLDGLGNQIAAQTIGLAQAAAGLDFKLALSAATTLNGGVSGIWSYSSGSAITPGYEGGRARASLGMVHRFGETTLSFSGYYDGIGADGFEGYGAEILVNSLF